MQTQTTLLFISSEKYEDYIGMVHVSTDVLNITGAPNNGTYGRLRHILKNPPSYIQRQSVVEYNMTDLDITLKTIVDHLNTQECANHCPEYIPSKVWLFVDKICITMVRVGSLLTS